MSEVTGQTSKMSAAQDEESVDEATSDPRLLPSAVQPKRPRGPSHTIDEAIARPGTIRINVTGAFIVNDDIHASETSDGDGAVHDSRDIRLPHHTGVVSHVAVDVRLVDGRYVLVHS